MVHPEQLLCHSHVRRLYNRRRRRYHSYPSPQNLPSLVRAVSPSSHRRSCFSSYDRIGAVHIQHHRLFQLPAGKCTGRLDHSLAFSSKGSAHHRFDHPDFRIRRPQAADVKAHLIYHLAWVHRTRFPVFINSASAMGLQSSVMGFWSASRRRHNDGCLVGLSYFSRYFLLKSQRIFRLWPTKADYRRLLPYVISTRLTASSTALDSRQAPDDLRHILPYRSVCTGLRESIQADQL